MISVKRLFDTHIMHIPVRRFIMQEKVLSSKKNGMAMMILFILLYAAATALAIIGSIFYYIPMAAGGFIWLSLGWIPFLGLKVLKPQEALVLTLFGNYVGTLKDDGFYWVNPFCTAVNPAAKTKLNQSGDVDGGNAAKSVLTLAAAGTGGSSNSSCVSKKISLKIMTLNNNRQKINDCLGNPVEIGIAVMWRVTDTAKAVFNVDNYKEYLLESLCPFLFLRTEKDLSPDNTLSLSKIVSAA